MKLIFKLEDGETYQTLAEMCHEIICPLYKTLKYAAPHWVCPIKTPNCSMVTADNWKEVIESEIVE